jgi:hypothetical protein
MSLLAAAAKAARRVYVRDDDGRFAEVPGVHVDVPDLSVVPDPAPPRDVRDVLRRFRVQAEDLDLSTEEGRATWRARAGMPPEPEPRQEGRTGRPYLMPSGIPEDLTEGSRFAVADDRIRSDLRRMEGGRLDEVAVEHGVALVGYGRTEDGAIADEDRFIADISRAILARQERERRARLGIVPLPLPSHHDVVEMYEGKFGREGYAVQVDEYRLGVDLFGETFISVDGTILDSDGYHVGDWSRALFPTQRRVEHSMLELGTSHRGTGFAQGWNAHAEQAYARAGYTSIRLTAGKEDGPRVWAKAGYRFYDDYVPYSIEHEIGLLAEGGDDADSAVLWHLGADTTETNENDVVPLVQQASDLFDRMQRGEVITPLEVADLGRDRPYVGELGSESVGEAILTLHGWRGEKDVLLLAPTKAATRTVRMTLEMLPGPPARGR